MAYDSPTGIVAASAILELVAVVCVGLRFFSRHKRGAPIVVSDWLVLAALVGATGLTIMEIYGVAIGVLAIPFDTTVPDMTAEEDRLSKSKQIELVVLLLGTLVLGLIKISVSFLYLHIFNTAVFRRVIKFWIMILFLWTVAFLLAGLLQCGSHIGALYTMSQDFFEVCGASHTIGRAMVGSDVATDFITLAIPIPMICPLHMSTARKGLVLATFMIGLLSTGASIGKAYVFIVATFDARTADPILTPTGISVWNLVEVQVGIIAACGPTLRPLLTNLFQRKGFTSLLHSIRSQSGGNARSRDHVRLRTYSGTTSTEALTKIASNNDPEVARTELDLPSKPSAGIARPHRAYVRDSTTKEIT